ncbi:MAG: HNH endonuclease [Deltaproteobacteria bacterium]|nr:HNH endonuclease [Deltaproteobacteria bacterium]
MIDGPVLVLNRGFAPVHITSVKRAICLVFKGLAQIVDEQYQVYDFHSWSELSAALTEDTISLTSQSIRVPRVIMLQFYDRLPRRRIRFSRENVYIRDKSTCQYCGKRFKRSELNIDHVVPVSQGGDTSWENVVCSCIPCNSKKGGRTPDQAKMNLLSRPQQPKYSLFMNVTPRKKLFEAWRVYMNPVDFAYWHSEILA